MRPVRQPKKWVGQEAMGQCVWVQLLWPSLTTQPDGLCIFKIPFGTVQNLSVSPCGKALRWELSVTLIAVVCTLSTLHNVCCLDRSWLLDQFYCSVHGPPVCGTQTLRLQPGARGWTAQCCCCRHCSHGTLSDSHYQVLCEAASWCECFIWCSPHFQPHFMECVCLNKNTL